MTFVLHPDILLSRGSAGYPAALEALGEDAPDELSGCGSLASLRRPLVALFSSVTVPGDAILAAYDLARSMRDAGVAAIGGFQSPLERGCLDFLLRGSQPVVVCPARAVEQMRAPAAWRRPVEEGRMLVLSPFPAARRRSSAPMADARNRMVVALAERVVVVHAVPGGRLHRLVSATLDSGKPVLCPDLPGNRDLIVMGAQPIDASGWPP